MIVYRYIYISINICLNRNTRKTKLCIDIGWNSGSVFMNPVFIITLYNISTLNNKN